MDDSSGPGSDSAPGRGKAYPLSDRERDYLMRGETGTDRPSRLKANIRKKRDRLPERLENLFLDVEYLAREDHLEPREWEDGWTRLAGSSRSGRRGEGFMRFGRRVGTMMRRLCLYPDGVSESDVWADIVFGFIDGLCFQEWDEHPRLRTEFMDSLLEKVEQRSGIEFDDRATTEENWFADWQDRRNAEVGGVQKISEILDSEDISRPRSVALGVHRFLCDGREVPPPEKITRDEVLGVVERNELVLRRKLQSRMATDISALQDRESGDLSALDFLVNIPDRFDPASSREIADEIGSPQEYLNNVAKLGLFLIGEEDISGEVWSGIPIIEQVGSSDTYGKREWQLTDYGKALRANHLDRSHSHRSLNNKEFAQEYFDHAVMDPEVRDHLEK